MKIVGFIADGKPRLGVIEGDQVIDLQAVDPYLPSNFADVFAKTNGDLKSLGEMAKNAGASARRPLAGLKFGLPVSKPGKDRKSTRLNSSHVSESRMPSSA